MPTSTPPTGPTVPAAPAVPAVPAPADDPLSRLADGYGVATSYVDWRDQETAVPTATVVAVLAALGVDASTPAAIAAAEEELRLRRYRRLVPPSVVTVEGTPAEVTVHAPAGVAVTVEVEPEGGGARRAVPVRPAGGDPVDLDGTPVAAATATLPADLPLGWHTLHAGAGARREAVPLAVTPARLPVPERREWGFLVQLYSVRSRRSWGLGDLADLRTLCAWSGGELGAGFLVVNPLHAGAPVPPLSDSPYLPSSRRFVDPIYLAVDAVPEYALLPADERARLDALGAGPREAEREGALLDRDAAWAAKSAALETLFGVPRDPAREADLRAHLARGGDALRDHATWCALAERHGSDWHDWPEALRDPRSPAVAAARDELADRVAFHGWLQWLLASQLADAQDGATAAGMDIGVVHDLAVGVSADGADAWALQDMLAQGLTVGAPPDAFNQLGQDWGQPPWRPDRLAETGYAPFRDVVRAVLAHAGGIRVDHVLGMFRLWWVPAGGTAAAGTYMRYDADAMIGVLALEAHRAGAVVIGEDLGTVAPGVRDRLRARGVLGTSLLWFENTEDGAPLPPEEWREASLATVTTHDLPPTAAFVAGEHVALRDRLGLLTRPVEEERAHAASERAAWMALLERLGLLAPGADEWQVVRALHALLARTPCRLIGVNLPDAVGDRRAQNLPGTLHEYPNWRIPLADGAGRPVLVEDLRDSPGVADLVRAVGTLG